METVKKERGSPHPTEVGVYESEVSPRQGAPPPNNMDIKPAKSYMPNYPTPPTNGTPSPSSTSSSSSSSSTSTSCSLTTLASVISTTSSSTHNGEIIPSRTVSHSVRSTVGGGHIARSSAVANALNVSALEQAILAPGNNFSGDIGDAVSKILEDYDWSKIPLANKDVAGNDRRKLHVKRPMNAFMVWAQEARRKLSCSHRQVHNAELSKSLGKIWRGMTDDQKRPFIERADQLRRKHKQEYPDYKYQPRRRKENVKSVSKCPQGNPVSMQDLSGGHHYVSTIKGGHLGLSHPLSPPSSPSGQGVAKGPTDTHLGDPSVFVPDCLTDTFENIDRAEMNRYLLPDQGAGPQYTTVAPHGAPGGLQPMTTMSMNTIPSSSNSCPGPMSSGNSPTLTSLPPMGSRLLPPAPPIYGGSNSPYYPSGNSPQPGMHGSPDLIVGEINGGVSPGGSPGSPEGDLLELQPRIPKQEPTSSLTAPKSANVNPFLHQNLCYSSQPYTTFQYPYPYATMWH